MLRKLLLIVTSVMVIAVFTGCDFLPLPTVEPSETAEDTPTQDATAEVTPEASLEITAEPLPTETFTPVPEPTAPAFSDLAEDDLGAAIYTDAYEQIQYISSSLGSDNPFVMEQCAYIVGQSMAMDGQTDIIFDFVEWLSDPEATEQYLIDYPGAAPEEYEFIQEIGYIRNMDTSTFIYRTSPETRYFLNRPLYSSSIGEVDYDEFRDWLFTTNHGFVIVCVVDDVIARVEWIFLP